MRLEDFDLKQDPFPIVPDGPVYNWAGRDDLKEDLVDLVRGVRGRDIGVTEFAILYGELGAGKSHALRFLKTMIDDETQKEASFNSLAIYLERPRVANKLNFLELHRYVIRQIGRDRVRAYCNRIKSLLLEMAGELAVEASMGHVKDKSSFVQAAVERFPVNDHPMIRVLLRGAEDNSRIFDFLLGHDKSDSDEYEGKIDSDFMAAKVLSDFFRVLSTEWRKDLFLVESVYLLIDECEVLLDVKASESELVFNGLRELINGLPYRFGLMLSFSAATALIEAVMPNHLLKRLTRLYIEVPMLDDEEAFEFLRRQIRNFRPEEVDRTDFYPFSEEAMRFIIEHTTTLTPRNLFIDCKRVLERAIRRYNLQPGETISRETAERILAGAR